MILKSPTRLPPWLGQQQKYQPSKYRARKGLLFLHSHPRWRKKGVTPDGLPPMAPRVLPRGAAIIDHLRFVRPLVFKFATERMTPDSIYAMEELHAHRADTEVSAAKVSTHFAPILP